jgi:hypothetical protein
MLVGDAGKASTEVCTLGARLQDTRGIADGRLPVQRGIGRGEGVNRPWYSGRLGDPGHHVARSSAASGLLAMAVALDGC